MRRGILLGTLMLVAACEHSATSPPTVTTSHTTHFDLRATRTLLIDTGPGSSEFNAPGTALFAAHNPDCIPEECANYQFVAGRFRLTDAATIETIEGWIRVMGSGSLAVAIRGDAVGDGDLPIPGVVMTSAVFDVDADVPANIRWHTFSGFGVALGPGTYWVTFEPVVGEGFRAEMTYGAPDALSDHAFHTTPNDRWMNYAFFGDVASIGVRIYSSGGATPADGIAALRAAVADLGLARGHTTSLDNTLRNAQNALAAGDIGTACGALATFQNQVRAHAGKRIAPSTADELIAEAASIRDALAC